MGYLEYDQKKTYFSTIKDGNGENDTRYEVKPLHIDLPELDENISPIE